MRPVLLSLLLGGCVIEPDPWGRSDLTVQGSPEFHGAVAEAVEVWDLALYPRCGTVFRIVEEDGRPLIEVPRAQWQEPVKMAYFNGDHIVVRAELTYWTASITAHELGHALGLDHVSKTEDPESLMHAIVNKRVPSPADVEHAARELGCR